MLENFTLDQEVEATSLLNDVDDKSLDSIFMEKSFESLVEDYKHCPKENGTWEGDRGDSKWNPEGNYEPQKANPEGLTWSKILNEYNLKGITFKEGEPDFSEISKGTVKISDFSIDRTINFAQADIKLAEEKGCSPEDVKSWRKENGYTWHECKNMETMQKVPSIIHNNISHSGGISKAKEGI